jgi:hypothetical protein
MCLPPFFVEFEFDSRAVLLSTYEIIGWLGDAWNGEEGGEFRNCMYNLISARRELEALSVFLSLHIRQQSGNNNMNTRTA